MDIHLPRMDGVRALRALRADPVTAPIPVIAVTASAMPLERAEILGAGFDGCFVKPLDVDEILVEVRAPCSTGRPMRADAMSEPSGCGWMARAARCAASWWSTTIPGTSSCSPIC